MLVVKQFFRGWRGGEFSLLWVALVLAVASVSGVAGFAERLEGAMQDRSRDFLAADQVLRSSRPIDAVQLDAATSEGLDVARIVSFRSMVFAEEKMLLVALRAASDNYPLRGELKAAANVFTDGEAVSNGPAPGEVWLDSRAFAQLGISPGASVDVGERQLRASRVLVEEPDRNSALNIYGPRALMNLQDLASTEVVQTGSVVNYRYLFAGGSADLQQYVAAFPLGVGQKWLSVEENQPAMADTLKRARSYLLLAASLALALSGAAIALTAQRYGQRNLDAVALMKTLGASRARIFWHYLCQLLLVFLLAAMVGGLLGELVQNLLLGSLAELVDADLPPSTFRPFVTALLSALFCLLSFAMPPIIELSRVSPLHVLRRRQDAAAGSVISSLLLGFACIAILMFWYSRDVLLTAAVMLGAALLLLLSVVVVVLMLALIRRVSQRLPGSGQRLAVSGMYRRRYSNAFQAGGIGLALMVLLSLAMLRQVLLKDWQQQLAEDTPNYFLVNVAAQEVTPLREFFDEQGVRSEGVYPMVRGRLMAIDGQPMAELDEDRRRHESLDRELNLSWAEELGRDNTLLEGLWWPQLGAWQSRSRLPVSVEEELASGLRLTLGTPLQFNIGGQLLEAEVSSIRSLNWASMRPNFYFVFPPNSLENFAGSYISSFYLPEEQRQLLVDLLARFPTMTLIEVGALLEQIQGVVGQLTSAIAVVLWLVLVCALLITVANVQLSFALRKKENALLRSLGASNRFLRRVLLGEFALLGALAGTLSAVGANICVAAVQYWALSMSPVWYWQMLPIAALTGGLLLAGLVWLTSRQLLISSPLQLLRSE
ncbi:MULTISPECIES: ABC transporter permease [Spongiibacter]|uniref:ABC transporter permease n=2 Tax=Spongiibacteraceae TaxID=1706375 RepID=UPI000C5C8FFA|nr:MULTISPECIES: FtsX-like permease family protein [Spongiibacter]MAY40223.1 permease [Spongiibacter sp.]MBI57909.1 permease [Spongiibacter sp.]|tara:strand:- start:6637 stop:9120 length:2484 start_codon:yes stop_codon:yes gene_type:complete